MPKFKQAAAAPKAKPDKRGKIAVRIFLLDEQKQELFPVSGNLREDLFIEEGTVGEVAALLRQTLFGPGESGQENQEESS